MQFDIPSADSSIIKVIGVGGGGSNAVNHMFRQGIKGVEFIVCNTDAQALEVSPIPTRIQLGTTLTAGYGAGSKPEVGCNAAVESLDEIRDVLNKNTKMVFITAGMGGGTGTGAAPIIAQQARELGILTVGIVTTPFPFEGKKRFEAANSGIEALKKNVDAIIIIKNEKLRELFGNQKISTAFAHADEVLTTAAKGIAEIITVTGYINVDFEDVRTAVQDSGAAIMGTGFGQGSNRAMDAISNALASPLLNDNEIKGARYILLNISYGDEEITMDEIGQITDHVQEAAGMSAEIIWGNCYDANMGSKVGVTLIATGFKTKLELDKELQNVPIKHDLNNTPLPKTNPEIAPYNAQAHSLDPQIKVNTTGNTADSEIKYFDLGTTNTNDHTVEFEINPNPPLPDNVKPQIGRTVNPFAEKKMANDDSAMEQASFERSQERLKRLKAMSYNNPEKLAELENIPAFERQKMKLDEAQHSSQQHLSRTSLNSDQDHGLQLRTNNSFLHDNPD